MQARDSGPLAFFRLRRPLTMSSSSAPWQDAWDRAQPTLSAIQDSLQSSPPEDASRILRVGQLDSELLDQELAQVLQQPLANALGQISVGAVSSAVLSLLI
jgi:peroxin-2